MSSQPIHTIAKWKVKPGQYDTVLMLLKELRAKSIEEEGNLFYNVYQDNDDLCTLILLEGYANEAALNQHRNSSHYIGIVVEKIRPLLASREIILMTPIEI